MQIQRYRIYIGLILLLPSLLFSTDYYVANDGSDDSTGTSISARWATIAKVNAASFSAGDNIYFNKGDTWREELTLPTDYHRCRYYNGVG
jgi:hypothetical protein